MRTDFRSNVPVVGELVTVVYRYYDHYYKEEGEKEMTFTNVKVIESDNFDPPMTFRILIEKPSTYAEKRMPERTLYMKHVLKLIRGGSTFTRIRPREGTKQQIKTEVKRILSSNGKSYYTVIVENGVGVNCTCPGFQFRKSCRHLKEATQ